MENSVNQIVTARGGRVTRRRRSVGVLVVATVTSWAMIGGAVPTATAAPIPVVTTPTPTEDGALIIDMGQTVQTYEANVEAFGAVYALLQAGVPVQWAINNQKADKEDIDFTVASVNGGGPKDYRGAPFVIAAEYADEAASVLAGFGGLTVDTVTGPFDAPIFEELRSWANVALDGNKGGIAAAYFAAAGIPDAAYRADVFPTQDTYGVPTLPFSDPAATISRAASMCT